MAPGRGGHAADDRRTSGGRLAGLRLRGAILALRRVTLADVERIGRRGRNVDGIDDDALEEQVETRTARAMIVIAAAVQDVVAVAAVERVIARPAVDDVVSVIAGDHVLAAAAVDDVIARPAGDVVVTIAAADDVVAAQARDRVLAAAADDAVVATVPTSTSLFDVPTMTCDPAGQQTGSSPSCTTTSWVAVEVSPLEDRAVHVTVVRPAENAGALLVTVTGKPHADVATGGVNVSGPHAAACTTGRGLAKPAANRR